MALARSHQRLVGEGPDAQRRGQLGAVGERHLLLGVEGVEAQLRAAALAGPALAADRAPVQHHEIAWLDGGYTLADSFHGARGFMAEQERKLVVDTALAIRQIGMAHPARDDVDDHLTRAGIRDDDVDQLDGLALLS